MTTCGNDREVNTLSHMVLSTGSTPQSTWAASTYHRLIAAVVLGAALAAFENECAMAQSEVTRQFLPVSMDSVGAVTSDVTSDVLLDPWLVVADERFIVVADWGDMTVKQFDLTGQLRWTAGRLGRGPGEFANIADIRIAATGLLWVYDGANRRVSVVDENGSFVRSFQLGGTVGPVLRIVPTDDDRFWVFPLLGDDLAMELDSDGGEFATIPAPQDIVVRLPESRQGSVAFDPATNNMALVFLYSSDLFVLDFRSGAAVRGHGVQPIPFPPIGWRREPPSRLKVPMKHSRSAAMGLGRLLVLFAGISKSGEQQRGPSDVVDLYRVATTEYEGSIRLPMPVDAIAVAGGGEIVGLIREPVPALRVWKIGWPVDPIPRQKTDGASDRDDDSGGTK